VLLVLCLLVLPALCMWVLVLLLLWLWCMQLLAGQAWLIIIICSGQLFQHPLQSDPGLPQSKRLRCATLLPKHPQHVPLLVCPLASGQCIPVRPAWQLHLLLHLLLWVEDLVLLMWLGDLVLLLWLEVVLLLWLEVVLLLWVMLLLMVAWLFPAAAAA
jgi:hypothetical protein